MEDGSRTGGWSARLPVKEQAASLFATGDTQGTQQALIGHLNQSEGNCDRSIWFMLFDLYWVLQQRETFEKLSGLFAQQFATSPPPWLDQPRDVASEQQIAGRNALVVDGPLGNLRADKLRDLVHQGRALGWIRIDLSRATLTGTREERLAALEQWYGFMLRLRQQHCPVLLMGEYGLVDGLQQLIASDHASDAVAWRVAMEFLQWRGHEEAHDKLSTAFLEKFDTSPPGFEQDAVLAMSPQEDEPMASSSEPGLLVMPQDGAGQDVPRWVAALESTIAQHGLARVDASQMRRLTFEAASLWVRELARRGWRPEQVVLLQPTELVATLLDIAGMADWAVLRPRVR
jgi:hypothetical protein